VTESAKKMTRHNVAIDYLRAFVVVLVLAHHSVIAYAPYAYFDTTHYLWGAPIVDSDRWFGFDLLTLFNDTLGVLDQSRLHHDFGDAELAMSADWSNQSELRIAKASGSTNVVSPDLG
jgi:hypothetical protein